MDICTFFTFLTKIDKLKILLSQSYEHKIGETHNSHTFPRSSYEVTITHPEQKLTL